jgi:hypothetical protein
VGSNFVNYFEFLTAIIFMKTSICSKSGLHNNRKQIIGWGIFFIGFIFSFGFNGLAAIADLNGAGFWGDSQDAVAFDNNQVTQAELVNIRCPILLAPGEEGIISATFQNPHQEKADILVKAVVSKGNFIHFRTVTGNLQIKSGKDQIFRWQITPQDIVGGKFILSRVFLINLIGSTPYPARTESCGVFILNIFGLKGTSIVILTFVISLMCLVVGSVLLYHSDLPVQKFSPRIDYGLYGLAGILLIDMIATLLGWWIFAELVLLLAVILTSILISYGLFQEYS